MLFYVIVVGQCWLHTCTQ